MLMQLIVEINKLIKYNYLYLRSKKQILDVNYTN
jgi:hypothetical protein